MFGLSARQVSALILVPAVLVVADFAASRTTLKFLLLPPFGALTYLVFVNPAGVTMNLRRVVLAPTATAAYAWILAGTLGYTPASVALGTLGTILIMYGLQATSVVPPLALELLTLLLHREVNGKPGYILSVLLFTLGIYGLYLLWLRLPLDHTLDAARTNGQTQ